MRLSRYLIFESGEIKQGNFFQNCLSNIQILCRPRSTENSLFRADDTLESEYSLNIDRLNSELMDKIIIKLSKDVRQLLDRPWIQWYISSESFSLNFTEESDGKLFSKMSENNEMIESIRNSFVTNAQQNSDRFHPKDVQWVKNNDWAIERFVLVTKTEDAAFKALVTAMEWRKSFGVNDFTDDYFPEEIYKIGEFTNYCEDKEGRPIVWFRLGRHYKSSESGLIVRQYLVYNFEKLDRLTKNQGWAIITDSTNSGISNVDLDFSNFMTDVLQTYYPRGIKYSAIIDMPWILNATSKAVLAFMNEELRNCVKFHKKQELTQYMETKYIPVHLNGSYDKDLVVTPAGVKPLEQLTHLNLNPDQIKKFRSTYKQWLK